MTMTWLSILLARQQHFLQSLSFCTMRSLSCRRQSCISRGRWWWRCWRRLSDTKSRWFWYKVVVTLGSTLSRRFCPDPKSGSMYSFRYYWQTPMCTPNVDSHIGKSSEICTPKHKTSTPSGKKTWGKGRERSTFCLVYSPARLELQNIVFPSNSQ